MVCKSVLLMVFMVLFTLVVKGQLTISDVEFENIKHKTVVNYLQQQMTDEERTFTDVRASLHPTASTDGFMIQEKEYLVKDSLEKVWTHYIYTNPGDAWNASKMKFGMMYSKNDDALIYPNDQVERIEEGQLIYVNLVIMRLKKIATAFEITKIDEADGLVEFSYVEDNMNHGKQQLNFVETPDGNTKIIHRSYFKSEKKFRDNVLYPYFHTRMTNTFHRKMKKRYKKGVQD